jgi:tetratricopeptide (TPR) repeat protein
MAARRAPALALAIVVAGCATLRPTQELRLGALASEGDPQHRASMRLVLDGLDADADGRYRRAQSRYERAIQVDANNPYAYLAIARHFVEVQDFEQANAYLDEADVLFDSLELHSPGAETHLIGLRGAALRPDRPWEAEPLLAEAAARSPEVWGDGFLAADELR